MNIKASNTFKTQSFNFKRRNFLIMGAVSLIAVVVVVLTLTLSGLSNVDAQNAAKYAVTDPSQAKTLKIMAVEHPVSFNGMNPYPTTAMPGQQLVAITVDLNRDFKDHIRSSETGEVYLSVGNTKYYTMDTSIPTAAGPGQKPSQQATFVFSVPQNTTGLVFHYGTRYTLALPSGRS